MNCTQLKKNKIYTLLPSFGVTFSLSLYIRYHNDDNDNDNMLVYNVQVTMLSGLVLKFQDTKGNKVH